MASKNSLKEPQKLTPSEVTRMFTGMKPEQATRYYNKCMTNPNTPPANASLLMQYRAQNPDKFLTEEQMSGSRRSQGSWMEGKGYSGGWRDRSNGRVYTSDGYSYDYNGRGYDPYGSQTGGWRDGGSDQIFQRAPREPSYSGGGGGFFRRRKPLDQPRSVNELAQTVKAFGDPVRGRLYLEKVIRNPDSHPETVANARRYIENGSMYIANDEQMASWTPRGRQGGSGRRVPRKPVGEARSPEEVSDVLTHLRSNVARTRYYDRVVSNPESNVQTVENLKAFRSANQQLFASDEEARSAPRTGWRSSFWKSDEEFGGMSPRKKYFFVGAVKRNSRSKNTAYGLRVITDPETSSDDREAMTQVVRENPLLFFRSVRSGRGRRGQ